jgi:tripartite-type tricarboxylate transporter receptor subunit TctC
MVRYISAAMFVFAATSLPQIVQAQAYPTKPVRLVVGFAPGGSTDVVARLVARKLTEKLGQPVVVENRGGAGSNIATQLVARSPADGYTLLFITSTQPVNVSLYQKLPYNLVEDFIGVAPATDIPAILATHPSIPAQRLPELIKLAKARPGEIAYASAGIGSAAHLAGELFKSMAGVDIRHIPYKGAGPAMTDMLGGHVHMQFLFNASLVISNEKAGKLRAIGVAWGKRLSNLPQLPTLDESGLKGFEATVWNGIVAPTGTPQAIVARINTQTAASLKELSESFVEMGAYPMFQTPEQYTAFIKSEIVKWADVVKRSGARAE